MQPLNTLRRVSFISDGSTQLFVGPASSSLIEQIKVLSSTRATSLGFDRAKNEFGRSSGLSRMNVPVSTSSSVRRFHSSSDPSHHSMRAGSVSWATSSTQAIRRMFSVGAGKSPGITDVVIRAPKQNPDDVVRDK